MSDCGKQACVFQILDDFSLRPVATQWLWTYNNNRPNMSIGGLTPAQKLKMAA